MSNPRVTVTVLRVASARILQRREEAHSGLVRAADRECWVSSAAGGDVAASSMSVVRH